MPIKELCRKGGFSDATFYKWRAKYGGMVQRGQPDRAQAQEGQAAGERTRAAAVARNVNEVWSMDFGSDSLPNGRRIKLMTADDSSAASAWTSRRTGHLGSVRDPAARSRSAWVRRAESSGSRPCRGPGRHPDLAAGLQRGQASQQPGPHTAGPIRRVASSARWRCNSIPFNHYADRFILQNPRTSSIQLVRR